MSRSVVRSLIIVVPCLLLIVATMLIRPALPSFAASASISLSLTYGPPTSSVTVSGKGFKGGETATISFDSTQVSTPKASSKGTFSSTITVPASALPGNHYVQARGKSSGAFAQSTFLVQSDWVQSRFNRQHTGFDVFENVVNPSNVSRLTIDWVHTMGGYDFSSAAVVNGIVYVGSSNSTMNALNASTGQLIWSYSVPAGGGIYSSPAVANGMVYFGSDSKTFYALNAATGALMWTFTASYYYIDSSPSVANGIVYFDDSTKFYALNATTGKMLWSYPVYTFYNAPAIDNGVVYINSDKLYALNATTGKLLWSYPTAAPYTTPAIANGIIYVDAENNNLYALNENTGMLLWSYPIAGTDSSPAVANGMVYVASNYLYAFNATTGSLMWTYPINTTYSFSSPTVANGVLYIGSPNYSNSVFAFNASAGTLLWSYRTGNQIEASPAIANGVLYIGSYDDNFYAFHLYGTTP